MSAVVLDLTESYWRALDLAEDWVDCPRCGAEFCSTLCDRCPDCAEDAL